MQKNNNKTTGSTCVNIYLFLLCSIMEKKEGIKHG